MHIIYVFKNRSKESCMYIDINEFDVVSTKVYIASLCTNASN